jgi:hypothetical protein
MPIDVNPAVIFDALQLLIEPGSVTELRALNTGKRTMSGYYDYDHLSLLAEHASRIADADGIYILLNPCDPALLARSANHVTGWVAHTTVDIDILRRRWLPIDFDPKYQGRKRPAGISSSEPEHEAALVRAQECSQWLQEAMHWPEPIYADSGNGGHLLCHIALPNDEASRELLKRVLASIANRFTDDLVDVDTGVFNAARIWKLYGTWAQKGDSIPERPYRAAKILSYGGNVH